MNIIFAESVQDLPSNYTALELDTFRLPPDGKMLTAWCVLEQIKLQDFPLLEATRQLHHDVMTNYKLRHWGYCATAIREGLLGRWNGEVDTFYQELLSRIETFQTLPPGQDWDGVIDRSQPA